MLVYQYFAYMHMVQMINLYRDPDGKLIFEKTDHKSLNTTGITKSETLDSSKVLALESRIVELESVLKDYQVSINLF